MGASNVEQCSIVDGDGNQCGQEVGHDGKHNLLIPSSAPWFLKGGPAISWAWKDDPAPSVGKPQEKMADPTAHAENKARIAAFDFLGISGCHCEDDPEPCELCEQREAVVHLLNSGWSPPMSPAPHEGEEPTLAWKHRRRLPDQRADLHPWFLSWREPSEPSDPEAYNEVIRLVAARAPQGEKTKPSRVLSDYEESWHRAPDEEIDGLDAARAPQGERPVRRDEQILRQGLRRYLEKYGDRNDCRDWADAHWAELLNWWEEDTAKARLSAQQGGPVPVRVDEALREANEQFTVALAQMSEDESMPSGIWVAIENLKALSTHPEEAAQPEEDQG